MTFKPLTSLLFALLTFSAVAQELPQHGKFKFGVNFSPEYSHRTPYFFWDRYKIGYTTGINSIYQLNNRIALETGLQYSNKGYQTTLMDLFYAVPNPNAPVQAQYVYNMHYLDIPLKANFNFRDKKEASDKKVRFFASVGLTTNLFIRETQTTILIYASRTDEETTDILNSPIRSVNFSPTLGFGYDFQTNQHSHLRIEPIIRYGLRGLTDAKGSGNIYSAGLNVSLLIGQ